MGPEKLFENKIRKFLESKGGVVYKIWGGGFQKAGIPDLLACYKGRFIAIEVKADKGRPSALQEYNIDKIAKSGGLAFILYPKDFERFKECINEI